MNRSRKTSRSSIVSVMQCYQSDLKLKMSEADVSHWKTRHCIMPHTRWTIYWMRSGIGSTHGRWGRIRHLGFERINSGHPVAESTTSMGTAIWCAPVLHCLRMKMRMMSSRSQPKFVAFLFNVERQMRQQNIEGH